mgnify:CR=1 FL=1
MNELTIEEFDALSTNTYVLYDIRSTDEINHGAIKGAIASSAEELEENPPEEKGKKIIICCSRGRVSRDVAENLCEQGYDAVSLKGGYIAWLMAEIKKQEADEICDSVEKSLRKKFHKNIFSKFAKAINQYELVKEGDRIAVCISGGKDSMLMAKLMQLLQRYSEVPFEVVFLVMDPGYNEINRNKIESNAALLHIPITVFETDVFAVANNSEKNPCYLCARMRRGYLYSKAQELGCNKIALGHHFNDVIETTVMSMFYGSQMQAMLPKLHSTNFAGMELIRPLYCIHEEDILAWKQYNDLEFIQCACRFTENCTMCDNGGGGSKRQEVKILLRRLRRDNPNIERSIFNSIHSVNLDMMPGYKTGGVLHSFLDDYDERGKKSE